MFLYFGTEQVVTPDGEKLLYIWFLTLATPTDYASSDFALRYYLPMIEERELPQSDGSQSSVELYTADSVTNTPSMDGRPLGSLATHLTASYATVTARSSG